MYFMFQPATTMTAVNLLVKQVFILLPVVSAYSLAIADNISCLKECIPVNNSFMGIPDNHMVFRFLPLELSTAHSFYLNAVIDGRSRHGLILKDFCDLSWLPKLRPQLVFCETAALKAVKFVQPLCRGRNKKFI